MKYVKKFETLQSANGFVIPNPFVGHVSEGGQVINCNEDGKKIEVNDGQIDIIDTATLISFTITQDPILGPVNYQGEQGMTWEEWCESDYNTYWGVSDGYVYFDNGNWWYGVKKNENEFVNPNDELINGFNYITEMS